MKYIQIKNEIPIVKLFYLETTSQLFLKRKGKITKQFGR
jgi:hypothetical protein